MSQIIRFEGRIEVLREKVFLEVSQNLQENTRARVSFLIKLQACNFIKKETLARVFSSEPCEISKNIFSSGIPLATASVFFHYVDNRLST